MKIRLKDLGKIPCACGCGETGFPNIFRPQCHQNAPFYAAAVTEHRVELACAECHNFILAIEPETGQLLMDNEYIPLEMHDAAQHDTRNCH